MKIVDGTITLTEGEINVLSYVKQNGKVSIDEIAAALGRTNKSVRPNLTSLAQKAGFLTEEKVEVEGAEKPVAYFTVTADGEAFAG